MVENSLPLVKTPVIPSVVLFSLNSSTRQASTWVMNSSKPIFSRSGPGKSCGPKINKRMIPSSTHGDHLGRAGRPPRPSARDSSPFVLEGRRRLPERSPGGGGGGGGVEALMTPCYGGGTRARTAERDVRETSPPGDGADRCRWAGRNPRSCRCFCVPLSHASLYS